jgi:hypothetical protein
VNGDMPPIAEHYEDQDAETLVRLLNMRARRIREHLAAWREDDKHFKAIQAELERRSGGGLGRG